MKEKVTFKSFFSTIWRGIVQVFKWFQKVLGLKGRAKYTRVIRSIVGTCLAIWLGFFTLAAIYSIFEDSIEGFISRNITGRGCYNDVELSPNVHLQLNWYDDFGRIYNHETQKVTINKVDWVVAPGNGDSLAVFCKKGKRGYINCFTGEIAIPAQYEKAWVFSEGLAAVQKDGDIMFIDHEGKTVLTGDWRPYYEHDILFRDGSCTIWDGSRHGFGVIDTTGAWKIEPEYNKIRHIKGMWTIGRDGKYGLLDSGFNEIFAVEYEDFIFNDNMITVDPFNEPKRAYSYDFHLINDCVFESVETIYYESGEDEYTLSSYIKYSVELADYDYRYGLLDRYGMRVTEPIYTSIVQISPDLFFCEPDGVIINGKGQKVK